MNKEIYKLNPKIMFMPGFRFAHLTVIKYIGKRNKTPYYLCKCDCGKETEASAYNLKKGLTKSCGCKRGRSEVFIEKGTTFGELTVQEHVATNIKSKSKTYRCICSCGKETLAEQSVLKRGIVTHCGCKGNKFNYPQKIKKRKKKRNAKRVIKKS